jgi:transcriptional regulator with XRE-family HTH domain
MAQGQASTTKGVGAHIREWRTRRRLSQLDFALEAEISQKHLSFIESGRSAPSRDMVLRLAEHLEVPLRERNVMVLAAGYAPVYPERSLDDPALASAKTAVELILQGHDPYPALAIDRYWNLVSANAAVHRLMALVADQSLLDPPINVLRLSLSPTGLAPHIANLDQWREHLLDRLKHQFRLTGDTKLRKLHTELLSLGTQLDESVIVGQRNEIFGGIAVPLKLKLPSGTLSLISTTTVFGTPVDVTLSELALETFFPADEASAQTLKVMSESETRSPSTDGKQA